MSLWGRRSASLVDVVQEAGKACFDDIPGIKEKTSTDFYLLHLIAEEILSGQRRAGNGGTHRHQTP